MVQACEANREPVVRFLLSIGVCPTTRDVYDRTPKEVAQVLGHKHLVALMESTVTNHNGDSNLLDD